MTDLVATADYRRVTQDMTTADGDVTAALEDALTLVDEHCKRHFAYGTYTETLYVYRDGKVYPTNTPLASVSTPALPATAIQGAGIWLGTFLPVPALVNAGEWQAAIPPQTTVTYVGGYQPYGTTNGPTPQLPVKVMRAGCRIAYLALHPVVLAGVPAGATSVSVGDVHVSAANGSDLSAFIVIDPSIEADLKRYVKRQVHGWQRS